MHIPVVEKWNDSYTAAVIQLLRLNTPDFFAPEEESDLLYYFENHAQHYFVLLMDGMVVGAGGYNPADDLSTAAISWDIIHPIWHGKGIGRFLTIFRINEIKKKYPSVIIIRVRTSQYTFGFYKKMGFRILNITKDFWAPGFDMYEMETRNF